MAARGATPVSQPVRIPDAWRANPTSTESGKPTTQRTGICRHTGAPDGRATGPYPGLGSISRAPVVGLGSIGWVPGGLGVVEGDEIPYKPWAAARKKENLEHWLDRDPEIKCFQPGVPRAMYMPHPFQIIQSATKIKMVFEYANAQRTIHLNKMEDYPNVLYMGYSVGHWEGDTLVVDVTDFTDATWFDRSGNFHSDALHVVERYTPMGRTPSATKPLSRIRRYLRGRGRSACPSTGGWSRTPNSRISAAWRWLKRPCTGIFARINWSSTGKATR